MTDLNDIRLTAPRPLPVIILADVSGSMNADGKIDVLNQAMADMLRAFAAEEDLRAEIHVAAITIGGNEAQVHSTLAPARSISWMPMTAGGKTPLGSALRAALRVIEDRTALPSRAYRPTVVLVSDGEPTDEWEEALRDFKSSEGGSKAQRIALAIGADANLGVLESFAEGTGIPVFRATDVPQITKFFRLVTMTVTARSLSVTPNQAPPLLASSLEELDF